MWARKEYPNYKGYSYLDANGQKIYYYYDHKINKDNIPREYINKLPSFPIFKFSSHTPFFQSKEYMEEDTDTKEERIHSTSYLHHLNYSKLLILLIKRAIINGCYEITLMRIKILHLLP